MIRVGFRFWNVGTEAVMDQTILPFLESVQKGEFEKWAVRDSGVVLLKEPCTNYRSVREQMEGLSHMSVLEAAGAEIVLWPDSDPNDPKETPITLGQFTAALEAHCECIEEGISQAADRADVKPIWRS